MKTTKDIQMEVMKVHNLFWESYARRDIELRFSLCSEDVTFIGSGLHERALNKTEYKNINKEGVKQFPNPFQIEFLWTNLSMINEIVACVESEVVWSQMINNEISTELLRNTTLLKYDNSRWLVTHVHGSVPDYRLKEGDYMTNEQTIIRNKELERQVFERTQELNKTLEKLEGKNRELEIEASLERVRAVAMSMNKPDDLLNICEVSFNEFKKLGFDNLRNSLIHILDDEKEFFLDYDFSDSTGGKITEIFYKSHPIVENYLDQIRGAEDAFAEIVISGSQLNDWKDFRLKTGQQDDPRLNDIQALYYYGYSIGVGDITISTFKPIDESKIQILKRFRNVFDLAYRRYRDIALAEAQAREAQIQLALERVRARTMAMQHSDELAEVSYLLNKQVVELGIPTRGCAFNIYNEHDSTEWFSNLDGTLPAYKTPRENIFLKYFEAGQRGETLLIEEFGKERIRQHYEYLFSLSYFGTLEEKNETIAKVMPESQIDHLAYFKYGYLLFITLAPAPEAHDIFKRFAKEFEQTYTRFLDLQKAEAQAREAQIEAALERIRSAAMAMRDSSALSELIYKLYGELTKLDAKLDRCFIMIVNSENRGITWWLAGKEGLLAENGFFIQMNQHPSHLMYLECWEKRKKKWHYLFEGKEKRDWDSFGFSNTELARLPEFIKKDMAGVKKIHLSGSSDQFGSLVTGSLEPLPEEQQDIISRFTIAFNQAFIRFLDLEKAEAQAREAHIEAALERVRARSLAMHHTSELQSVVDAVSQQLKNLDIDANGGAFISINNEVEKDIPIWGSSGAANYIQKVTIPFLDKPIFTQLRDAIKNRNDFFVEEYTHKEKIEFLQHIFNHSPWNLLPPKRKKELLSREGGYTRSLTVSRYTSIFIINHNGKKFSESDNEILKRFGKVFEQSYTRFLDLQKAEAQNKIIQAENERKSKELDEARELQLAMLPKQIPLHPKLDIKVYMQTATEVGGDYYDFSIHNDGSINIAIGDATGHGLKAGTLVTMMKSLFTANSSSKEIEDFFFSSNAAIKNSNLKRMMIGFAMLNIKDYKARFINAAMPSLYHYRKKLGKVEEIEQHNLPLGAMAIENYISTEISLNKGDVLIMMSDGFPELHNPNGELFGYERAYAAIQKAADKQPEEIIKSLNNETIKWIGNKDLQDDVTFVVIKVK